MHFNVVDWQRGFEATDDFIVYPMSWVGCRVYLDVEEGVPRQRLEQLREKKLFLFRSDWDHSWPRVAPVLKPVGESPRGCEDASWPAATV
jgi:hypothetical protein